VVSRSCGGLGIEGRKILNLVSNRKVSEKLMVFNIVSEMVIDLRNTYKAGTFEHTIGHYVLKRDCALWY
jgi:hypothetical protein